MSETSFDTLGAIGERFVIFAFCGECRRDAKLDVQRLIARHGAALSINVLRQRVTCRRCGQRTRTLRIVCERPAR